MNYQQLTKYCRTIFRIAGEKAIDKEQVTGETIIKYYLESVFFYQKFHSAEGAMHLPISFSTKDSHDFKLRYQANCVNEFINKHNYTTVLELGCGQGFNSIHLAKKNPTKTFSGIDLTVNNIKIATSRSKELANISFSQADYDNITSTNQKYDLIFAVETLCYSKNLVELISTLHNKLNENGRIVIFDGYECPNAVQLTKEFEKQAYKLLSWGFELTNGFQKLGDIQSSNKLNGFEFEDIKDYTENVLPNYTAFQNGAMKALRYPLLLKILLGTGIISIVLIKQLSAGLFGPYFLKSKYWGYYKLVLVKNGTTTK